MSELALVIAAAGIVVFYVHWCWRSFYRDGAPYVTLAAAALAVIIIILFTGRPA